MYRKRSNSPDVILLVITVLLVVFGILMIYSTSGAVSLKQHGNASYYLKKQMLWSLIGFIAMMAMMNVDYKKLRTLARPLLIISGIFLILALLKGFGLMAGGAQRWLKLGPLKFQPSELAKLAIIVYMAEALDRKQNKICDFKKGLVPYLVILGIFAGLIMMEPDLGTTVVIAGIVSAMLFMGGAKLAHMGTLVLTSLPVLFLMIFYSPYRMERIMAFFNPGNNPAGTGYQIGQSLIALGSGGVTGVGLGNGKQKLFYLPASHTDFILPIIGEELGFIGTMVIISLLITFAWRGMKISLHAPDLFGRLLAGGVTFMITLQAVINIGVVTSSLPTKGIPLPFLSFGGSSLVCNLLAVGVLLNISSQSESHYKHNTYLGSTEKVSRP